MRGELNIPNRDRRARRRILTLKNAGFATLGLVVLMVGVVLYARRHNDRSGDYGRLSTKQGAQPLAQAQKNLDVITEGSASDRYAPDPMLSVPAVNPPQPHAPPQAQLPAKAGKPPLAIQPGDRVAIAGDDKGVSLTRSTGAATPKLSGGFGKAQDPPVTVTDGTTRQ